MALGPRRWAVTAVWLVGVIAVIAANLRLARTRAVNSDGASNALQAWDMLHGNVLLHGWTFSPAEGVAASSRTRRALPAMRNTAHIWSI